jgi:hypothetical protein
LSLLESSSELLLSGIGISAGAIDKESIALSLSLFAVYPFLYRVATPPRASTTNIGNLSGVRYEPPASDKSPSFGRQQVLSRIVSRSARVTGTKEVDAGNESVDKTLSTRELLFGSSGTAEA